MGYKDNDCYRCLMLKKEKALQQLSDFGKDRMLAEGTRYPCLLHMETGFFVRTNTYYTHYKMNLLCHLVVISCVSPEMIKVFCKRIVTLFL